MFDFAAASSTGYDVADYRKIDPRYGTMEDFEELCIEAKKRNIDIMLDMVFNHTSTEHEWFQKALSGDPYYKNFYIFRKGRATDPLLRTGSPNSEDRPGNTLLPLMNTIFIFMMLHRPI